MRQRLAMFAALSLIGMLYVLAALPKPKPPAPTGLIEHPPKSRGYLVFRFDGGQSDHHFFHPRPGSH